MSAPVLDALEALVKDLPHKENCASVWGEQLCSCGKKMALELLDDLRWKPEDNDED